MSLELVFQFTERLPFKIREEVLGYARSVEDALDEIFRDAEIKSDRELGDQLVFLAGVKKLHAVCTCTFWILENSLTSLQQSGTYQVRIGSLKISRNSREYKQLADLLNDLELLLSRHGLTDFVRLRSYAEILQALRDERRKR